MEGLIEIKGLRLFARHGVYDEERVNGNTFELNVTLRYPIEKAMESDELDDTLNYAEAVEIIKAEMDKPSMLLENVVGHIRKALMSHYPSIGGGSIELIKLNPPIPHEIQGGVAVKIAW